MDLNIERRPLSALNKIDPKDNIGRISSTIKTYVPQTTNKIPTVIKPSITNTNKNKIIKQKQNNKTKTK